MRDERLFASFLYSSLPFVGTVKADRILTCFDDKVERLLTAGHDELIQAGLNSEQAQAFLHLRDSGEALARFEKMRQRGIQMSLAGDASYPKNLLTIPGRPLCLFYRGTLPDSRLPAVAVVGSRRCSLYGRQAAEAIADACAAAGIGVISGLAAGIDGAAGRAALKRGGKTWAVLGCGVDICYPRENFDLMEGILQSGGGILSEYPPGTPPLRWHFPVRNRIISGLSDICVIVEAAERSGSLITADQAAEQGRDVLALPGRVSDTMSKGCNWLIAQGAQMILGLEDVTGHPDICHKQLKRSAKGENG